MKIKLVIADVDGTLVTRQKVLTTETCQGRAADLRSHGADLVVSDLATLLELDWPESRMTVASKSPAPE